MRPEEEKELERLDRLDWMHTVADLRRAMDLLLQKIAVYDGTWWAEHGEIELD